MRAESIVCSGWRSNGTMSNVVLARVAFFGQNAVQF